MNANPDVLVIGGGIAGLGAALRLQDRGLRPLVLESEPRVGGRMTTDRVGGFVIDRAATLLGRGYPRMLALARRLGLGPEMQNTPLALTFHDADGCRCYRARRPDDFLRDGKLAPAARAAFLRVSLDVLWHRRALVPGQSHRNPGLDSEDCRQYLARFGRGGEEVFARVCQPAMKFGWTEAPPSRATLMQVVWNLFGRGLWNLPGGLDRIPEAIAARVPVQTGARVRRVCRLPRGVEVTAEVHGETRTLHARGTVFAVPGQLVPGLCPQLPAWITEPLGRTRYAGAAVVAVALRRPPELRCTGYAFAANGPDGVGILEMQHVRAPGRCPEGKGMLNVYLHATPTFPCLDLSDAALEARAIDVVTRTFPEVAGAVLFTHLVRWPVGNPIFLAGRVAEMAGLRKRLEHWDAPLDLCGDYLDGPFTEGALQTGEQAAERLARRLS